MAKKIIKVVDPVVAQKMAATGFHYILEKNGETTVYAFSVTPQQMLDLQKQYSNNVFIVENRLRF